MRPMIDTMSAAGLYHGANCCPAEGSEAVELTNEAASAGAHIL